MWTIILIVVFVIFIILVLISLQGAKLGRQQEEMRKKYALLIHNITKTGEFELVSKGGEFLHFKSNPSLVTLEVEATQSSNILSVEIFARMGLNIEATKIEFRENDDQNRMTYNIKFLLSSILQKQVDKVGSLLPDKQAYIDRYKWNKSDGM